MVARVIDSTGVVGALADLRLRRGAAPTTVAHEFVRLVNGQWWYAHNTGDTRRLGAAVEAERLGTEAIAGSVAPTSTAQRLGEAVVTPDVAYAAGPEMRLGCQVELP
jgi:hypothetical protein